MHILVLNNLILLLVLIINRTKVNSFNIEERNPIVKRAKLEEKGSYFGFSVAQHQTEQNSANSNNWILIGAPLGQNLQPGSNRSGALFKCPVTTDPYDCIQVETDGKRFDDFEYSDVSDRNPVPLEPPGIDEIKDGQWLGVTVKSQKPGGKVIVCAHRYIQSPNLKLHHYGIGLCYVLNNNLETEADLQPCKGRPMDKLHQQYGFCQAGTSLALLEDGMALMGSPGPYTWRGTIFAKEVVGNFFERDGTNYKGPLNDNPKPIDKYSYLGMSVAGGNFFDKKRITFASGAPRSQLYGQVYFFEKRKNVEELNISLILTGEQFASSFGYEILAIDINKDGYDDLLVGAPFYFNEQNGGAVYIYYNLRKCTNQIKCKWNSVLKGKHESRFGFSMTSLGDINKDGFTDIAIGAPYENDEGAIYIYLGSINGINNEPSQIIKRKHLKTLGYSLSGGLDMDNNGYPDLLVGAYESDLVILYKTRPIIDISIKIYGEELLNINSTRKGCNADSGNTENTCFSFKSCFVFNEFKTTKSFKVQYQIKEVLNKKISRVWLRNLDHPDKRDSGNRRFIEIKNPKKQHCQEETVYIKEGIGDIISPIKFLVNYTLENNDVDSPILNKTSVKQFEATFQKSCGEDDICESNLVLSAGTQLERSEEGYVVNLAENEEFLLDANVTNIGESAYEAKLFIVHPEALSYIALQVDKDKTNNVICSYENDTLIVCNLGNPFQENQSTNLRLRFEINKNTRVQKLQLDVFVNSTSKELSRQTSQSFVAILQKIAEFSIEGKAITPHLFFAGEIKGQSAMHNFEDIGARVYHLYQVINHGQWQLQDMEVKIMWPYQVYSEHNQGKWLLYLENTPKIDGNIQNYCYVEPIEAVNPLKLNSSGLFNEEAENFTEIFTFTKSPEEMRIKRDIEYTVSPQIITGPDGKQRKVVTMDCILNSAKCALITCKINKLNKGDQAKIKISSRIWNSTLVEDYSNVDWVSIRSFAKVFIADETIIHSNDSIETNYIETIAYPGLVLADTSLNIWIIIGAVLAGLLLLILLIFILYKVGFFKRNRIKDQTLSGNLKKQGESESLLKVNEGKT